jgi:hypothetical protein
MVLALLGMALGDGVVAGGIDRSGQRLGPLFENGAAFEFSTSVVSPQDRKSVV